MTTHLKSMANRRNAARSTGPRSAVGKVRSSINAIQHGLRSESLVLPGERAEDWQAHCQGVVASLRPAVGLEMDEATRRQARALLHGPTIQPIRGCLMDRLVALLRGRDDDKGQRAREALVAIGPPAVPALLAALWASRRRAAVSMRVAGTLAEIAPVVPERESLLMVAYLNSFTICSDEEAIRGACRQVLDVLQLEHQRLFAAWSQTDDVTRESAEES